MQAIAPEWHCARGSTSTLAKLINWHNSGTWQQVKNATIAPQASQLQEGHTKLVVIDLVYKA